MTRNLEIKVGIFIIAAFLILGAALAFFAYKKDVFTRFQSFTLTARAGDHLVEGMPVIFSGFNIGRIHSLELNEKGFVLIEIRVSENYVRWLRQNSVFVVEKPLLGPARLLVNTPEPFGPPLTPENMPEIQRISTIDDITRQLQPIFEQATRVAGHLEITMARIADPEGDLAKILQNAETITARLSQKNSLLELAIHDRKAVQAIVDSLRKTRDITNQIEVILKRVDSMAQRTDEGLYGREGILPQVNKLLSDTRVKLDKVSVTLDNVNKITGDVAAATADIKRLRQELDGIAGSVNELVTELNRRIPFRRQPVIKLP